MSDKLKTDYIDDELDVSMDGRRRYKMIENSDGTISLEDQTAYSKVGTTYSAEDVNKTNEAINQVNENLTERIYEVKTLPSNFGPISTTTITSMLQITLPKAGVYFLHGYVKTNKAGRLTLSLNSTIGTATKQIESNDRPTDTIDTIYIATKDNQIVNMSVGYSSVNDLYVVGGDATLGYFKIK